MNKKQLIIILCGIVVGLGFSLGIYGHYNKKAETLGRLAQDSNSVFNRPHSPTYGSPTAKVRIVEFFDPACETCRAFYPIVKGLVDAQPGKVQLVVRYVPFHNGSEPAVRILEAARLQGLFWPVTEAVLKAQPTWASHDKPNPERIWEFLGGTGLDIRKAKEDANTPQVKVAVNQDLADANLLQVTKTPGFFVNGKPLKDFGYEQLKALVQQEVAASYPQ